MNDQTQQQPGAEQTKQDVIGGVPHHLLDGYDGGTAPPPEYLAQMLAKAPPEIQARAKEWAQQRAAGADKQQPGEDAGQQP